ncbi:hypothetical protein M0805_009442 [Coniferiporia weirii]|nr:hypothetical protein M0805_009442 [Coniferiporia weirii]
MARRNSFRSVLKSVHHPSVALRIIRLRASRFLHIKAIEVDFRGNRPRYPITIKLKADEGSSKSPRFERDRAVRWDLENYIHFSATAKLTILIQEVHTFNRKTDFAVFNVASADMAGKDVLSITHKEGKALVKLTCVLVAPSDDFAELLIKEAQGQLGNKRIFLQSLGMAGRAVATVMKFADLASDVHPAAKAAIVIMNVLYERCKLQQECHSAAAELLTDLASFLPFTKDLTHEVMLNVMTRRVVREMLELFCRTAKSIIEYSSVGLLGDLISSHKEEIGSFTDNFKKLKDTYDWCIKLEVWRSVIETEKHIEDTLLQRLHPARQAYYDVEKICLEGTRTSVLQQIGDWAVSDSKVFWLHGVAGSGKSSIANSVARMFEQQLRLSGCFFCKRDDPECRVTKNVIPTLAYHLSKWHAGYRSSVLSVIQGKDEPKLARSVQWQFDLLIRQPLISLSINTADLPPKPLIIVIDALDECGDSADLRSQLAEFIVKMSDAVPWLKIFITSRPLPEFQRVFGEKSIGCRALDINTEIGYDRIQEDILQYTRYCARKYRLEIGEREILALTSKASGLFIWTSTVFKFIDMQINKRRAIDNVLIATSLGSPEAELDCIYAAVVQNASAGHDNAEIVKYVLGIITCTAKNEPLSENALVHFLSNVEPERGIDQVALKEMVDRLQAVLYRDGSKGNTIRACHPSFLDFIGSQSRCLEFWTDPMSLEFIMATKCLDIMISELKFNICDLQSSYEANDNILDLEDRIFRCIPQHLQYSCLYWINHMINCSNGVIDQPLQDQLYTFLCQPSALYWLECLSITKELKAGTNILERSLRDFKLPEHIASIVGELHRFISAFHTAIATAAPHLYISAMSWVPTESCLIKHLYPIFYNQPIVSLGKAMNWKNALWIANARHCVLCAAYSPDGRHIVTGSDDCTLQVWDAQTGIAIGGPLRGHSDFVQSVVYSPDGRHVVSGSDDYTLCIWDAHTGDLIRQPLVGHLDCINAVAISPDGKFVVSGSDDSTLRIWDMHTGAMVGEPLVGHMDEVKTVSFSPDGRLIVSGSPFGIQTLQVWDMHTKRALNTSLKNSSTHVNTVAFSPNGRHIAFSSDNNNLYIWDVQIGKAVGQPLTGHSSTVKCIAYSPNGRYIVSGSRDHSLRIWDLETRNIVGRPLIGHSDTVNTVSYSPDGRYIMSGSDDMTIRIWDAQVKNILEEPLNNEYLLPDYINAVAYSPDGRNIVSSSRSGTLNIWDAQTGDLVKESPRGRTTPVQMVSWSPDGRHIAFDSSYNTLRIWDTHTDSFTSGPLKGHLGRIRCITYSPDGKYIASCSNDCTIRIWDAQTGDVLRGPLTGHSGHVNAVAYSPDGKYIVSGSDDCTLRIWDALNGSPVGNPLGGHSDGVNVVAYSPDGRHVASSSGVDLRVWDTQAVGSWGSAGVSFKGHTGYVSAAKYSPDGRYIVSASEDMTVRIWDMETGLIVGEPLRGHSGFVNAVAYSPDGKNIVSSSSDGTLRIWDTSAKQDNHSIKLNQQKSFESDGWVKGPSGELMFWVPHEYRHGIRDMCERCIPGDAANRPVRVDWENLLKYSGSSWINILRD